MNGKSSAELERDAEAARASVAETADAIRSKMTPGQMIDEFTGMFSGGDAQATINNLKAQIRDNPLPLTLVGAGLAWLMMGQGASPTRSAGYDDRADEIRPHEGGMGNGVMDAIGDTGSEAMSKAGRVFEGAKEAIGEAGSQTAEAAQSFKGGAADIARRSKGAASEMFEKEPLVLAALGMAIGTAIGVLLPHSDIEDEHLGAVSSKARATAEDLLNKGVAEAKDMAADAYQTVKKEADRQGLSGEEPFANRVAEVVKSAAKSTEGAVRDKLNPEQQQRDGA